MALIPVSHAAAPDLLIAAAATAVAQLLDVAQHGKHRDGGEDDDDHDRRDSSFRHKQRDRKPAKTLAEYKYENKRLKI